MRKITLFIASLFIAIGAMAQGSTYRATSTKITATELNEKAEETYIAIGCLSRTLNGYFTGNGTNANFTNDAVFIWEPKGDGTFYIKNLSGQYMQNSNPKTWGTIDAAAYFTAINATTAGSGNAYFNGDSDTSNYIESGTDANLVRFLKGGNDATTWINIGTNAYNSGKGGWTIYYIYAVEEVPAIDITYKYIFNGETKKTEVVSAAIGEEYPEGSTVLPFGVTATKPAGTVLGDETEINIEVTVNLPFEYYNSYSEVTQWYYVNVRDDGPTYMYYDSSIEYIKATATEVPSDAKDAYSWAFIGNPFDGFKIVNLLAGSTMVLSSPVAPTANQDASQIVRMVTEEGAAGNIVWDFVTPTHENAAANGFYIQHPTAPAYALNRQGYNGANTVCYWNGRDTGSTFQVVARPSVQDEFEALIETAETELAKISALVGEGYGYYTQSIADALSNAIEVARAVTVADESDVETLRAAINADRRGNIPAAGALIAFQSASTQTYCANKYVKTVPVVTNYSGAGYSADRDHTQLVFDTFEPATTPSAVFQVIAGDNEGEFKLKNMHTQEYVVSFVKGAQHMGTEANAVAITLKPISEGQIAVFGANNGMPMHAQEAHNVIVTWNAETNNASVWKILDVEEFAHELTVSEVGYATLQLGFDAIIPAGAECYKVVSSESDWVNLEKVESVLPAGEAVIVKATQGTYNFKYTTGGTKSDDNKLVGTLYDKYITDVAAYVLSAPDTDGDGVAEVGLYKAKFTSFVDTSGTGQTVGDANTFLNNANKVYLPASALANADGIASYSFNFDWAGTTGIEGVEAEGAQNSEIYDITGRKVKAITAPGIYIVNGAKVVIK